MVNAEYVSNKDILISIFYDIYNLSVDSDLVKIHHFTSFERVIQYRQSLMAPIDTNCSPSSDAYFTFMSDQVY